MEKYWRAQKFGWTENQHTKIKNFPGLQQQVMIKCNGKIILFTLAF